MVMALHFSPLFTTLYHQMPFWATPCQGKKSLFWKNNLRFLGVRRRGLLVDKFLVAALEVLGLNLDVDIRPAREKALAFA